MATKEIGAIKNLKVDTATYRNEELCPNIVNFFFGNNGSGKSTIARTLKARDGITWATGISDYSILVYNDEFIAKNLESYDELPGVFTIGEESIENKTKLAEATRLKAEQDKIINDTKTSIEAKQKALEQETIDLEDVLWEKAGKIFKADFPESLRGFMSKKAFKERVLNQTTCEEQNLDTLKKQYDTSFDANAKSYAEFKKCNPDDLASNEILNQSITSSSNSEFASFIKAINATDWLREGHEHFATTEANGKCPYCQQSLPDNFIEDVKNVFDSQYDDAITKLNNFRDTYRSNGGRIYQDLKNNKNDCFPKLVLVTYDAKLESLVNLMQLNIAEIDKKIKEPSLIVELQDTFTILSETNELITGFNELIKENNDIVTDKKNSQKSCTDAIWKHIGFITQSNIKTYQTNQKSIQDEIKLLVTEQTAAQTQSRALATEINELSKTVVSTKQAVDNINQLLTKSGFEGFKIEEKQNIPNTYHVIRDDGSPVSRLSEGEQNFIAFMYFYQLVKGSETSEGTSKEKIVVIDDPVSSLDSTALFLVSSLVREMIDVTLNRFDLNYEENAIQGFYIKQLFILTHNAYYHREITYNQVRNYQYVNFYLISKVDNCSHIRLCTEQNPDIPSEEQNCNPVQNSYSALWEEYREVKRFIPLMNVIHRILDYYFLQLCGYDGSDIRDMILEKHKDDFITTAPDGKQDTTQYSIAQSMLAYLSRASNKFNDDINFVTESIPVEQCKSTFELIFKKLEQEQHYNIMMNK